MFTTGVHAYNQGNHVLLFASCRMDRQSQIAHRRKPIHLQRFEQGAQLLLPSSETAIPVNSRSLLVE